LSLRLDAAGAYFQNIPVFLYAWRSHSQSTAQNRNQKDFATPAGIQALQDYSNTCKLDWVITEGKMKTTYRAIPKIKAKHVVQVVVPYRDQKTITLKAIRSVLSQKHVELRVTAVDNQSEDRSIQSELEALKVEVLRIDEPFNYSRINNLAVHRSRYYSETDSVLFLNNDVELEPDALEEMTRWLDQPKVGMIGAKLNYPNGNLQHGGVLLDPFESGHVVQWVHIDGNCLPNQLGFSNILGVCDAVTGACALLKKENFLKVGGFDEIWYPIAFSDTDLATKLRRIGLYSLYTPYACGVHYESLSRSKSGYEQYESSYWLFRNTEHRETPQERLKNFRFLTKS
jgi:GT2 family glycosyltransferase